MHRPEESKTEADVVNLGFVINVIEDPIFIIGSITLTILYIIGVIIIRKMVDIKV